MATGGDVRISVESLLEQEIDEISRTGEETYIKPLTLAEELKSIAQKIDFSDTVDDGYDSTAKHSVDKLDKDDESKESGKANTWPWENVQRNLRNALSEIGILLDVLQVVSSKKYVVLDPVSQSQEPPKPTVQMLGKKKALNKAADVIKKGAERMVLQQADRQQDEALHTSPRSSYYHELMKLRRGWRLKRSVNNAITGDLSYRNDGSQFWHQGLFEVKKEEIDENTDLQSCPIAIKVPPDLEGSDEISVSFNDSHHGQEEMGSNFGLWSFTYSSTVQTWQKQLKQAQYNLFCKELFTQISREAYHENVSGFDRVTEKEVTMELFEGVKLSIKCQSSSDKSNVVRIERDVAGDETFNLACRLQQLLHEQHKRHFQMQPPHPATCSWAPKSNPPFNLHFMLHPPPDETKISLCATFLSECRHCYIRQRANEVLEQLSRTHVDPKVSFHWNPTKSPANASVTVHLVSAHHSIQHRTSIHIRVDSRTYHVVCMDGTVHDYDYEDNALEVFLNNQLTYHLRETAMLLFDLTSWQILHKRDDIFKGATVALLTVSSRIREQSISLEIRSPNDVIVKIYMATEGNSEDGLADILDEHWAKHACVWRQVSWTRLEGNNFIAKLRTLLANLS